jgi:ABC-type sugar transport system ATPase subunit
MDAGSKDRATVQAFGVDAPAAGRRTVQSWLTRELSRRRGARPSAGAVRETIDRVGLAVPMDTAVRGLDAGDLIRLALVRAVLMQPDALVLDAPLEIVPEESRDIMLAEMGRILPEIGGAIVYLPSLGREALALGGRCVVLQKGRIVQSGATDEVSGCPVRLAVARSMSHPDLNTMELTVIEGVARTDDGARLHPPRGLSLPAEGRLTLAIRPEDLSLDRTSENAMRVIVRFDGEEAIGSHGFLKVRSGRNVWRVRGATASVPVGYMTSVFVEPERIMVFDADGQSLNRSELS